MINLWVKSLKQLQSCVFLKAFYPDISESVVLHKTNNQICLTSQN